MPELRPWKTLPSEHKDYVFIYVAALFWCVSYFIFFPVATISLADRSLVAIWILPVLVGAVLAIFGLLRGDNLLMERLGVGLTMIGPAVYGLIQFGITIQNFIMQPEGVDLTARISLIFFALWLFLFLNKRRRQLKRKVTLVKAAPLPSETGSVPVQKEEV